MSNKFKHKSSNKPKNVMSQQQAERMKSLIAERWLETWKVVQAKNIENKDVHLTL